MWPSQIWQPGFSLKKGDLACHLRKHPFIDSLLLDLEFKSARGIALTKVALIGNFNRQPGLFPRNHSHLCQYDTG